MSKKSENLRTIRNNSEKVPVAPSDCRKTSLKEINGVWGEAPSKVAGAAAPDNKPGTDAGRVCQKALHDAEPTKHTQPFNVGKAGKDA